MGVSCPFAHSRNDAGDWHTLADHLTGTAELARGFGGSFGCADLCYSAGLWHDIGKASSAWQNYLAAADAGTFAPRVDHKCAGALVANEHRAGALSLVILGHHGGLPNHADGAARLREASCDQDQMARIRQARAWASASLPDVPPPDISNLTGAEVSHPDRDALMRLIFSAVVDADFLDTEAHFDAGKSHARRFEAPSVDSLVDLESIKHDEFIASRRVKAAPLPVDAIRDDVRSAALNAARQLPGLFRLTVPTGGGKTRAALAFALRHAACHGLDRVVVALPYITITDQTAEVYRDILGDNVVLEHHSGVDLASGSGVPAAQRLRAKLASENWDAPVIVTTTVQLFHSLFSNKTSSLRKAHRLARSVIILDEAQVIRLSVLGVTVDALVALARRAGASIVFCTATQPALELISEDAGDTIREIVPNHRDHFVALRRVTFAVPAATGERWPWGRVADEMRTSHQALAIVNTRRDALRLLQEIEHQAFHLSTLLCGAHRRDVLHGIKKRLANGDACRLVSTQVVEAGVDIDFPLVLRAVAPFDAVVQAAGRCNREGLLAASEARCIVFRPEGEDCFGEYRVGRDEFLALAHRQHIDVGSQDDYRHYLEALYATGTLQEARINTKNIRALIANLEFERVARDYRLIDDDQVPLVVMYARREAEIERLMGAIAAGREPGRLRRDIRALQPYTVSVRRRERDLAAARGLVATRGGLDVWIGEYDDRTGAGSILGLAPPGGGGLVL